MLFGTCTINPHEKAVVIAQLENGRVLGIDCVNALPQRSSRIKREVSFHIPFDSSKVEGVDEGLISVFLINEQHELLKQLPLSRLNSDKSDAEKLTPKLLSRLVPSIGFFGDAKNSKLRWDIARLTEELYFTIEEKKSLLNIGGIALVGESGDELIPGKDFTVTYSSSEPTSADPVRVFEDKGFHSAIEDFPFIKVSFAKPRYIKYVQIRNRADKRGKRARALAITHYCSGQAELRLAFDSEYYRLDFLSRLEKVGLTKEQMFAASTCREELLTGIKNFIKGKRLCEDSIKTANEFLSTWSDKKIDEKSLRLELEILAVIFANQILTGMSLNFRPYTSLLQSRSCLDFFENQINENLKLLGNEEIKITKHGLANKGELIDNNMEVMGVLKKTITLFEELGLEPQIAYGTLLGAYRDKGFIQHDDDVDILVKLSNQDIDQSTAIKYRDLMLEKIPDSDYLISKGNEANLNVHIRCRVTNIMIDVFPFWINNDKAFLYMENMRIRGIDKRIFEGRSCVNLYGSKLPTPQDIETFLLERYGPTWAQKDKYHEWPWKLADT